MMRHVGEYMRGMSVLLSDVAIAVMVLMLFPLAWGWEFQIAAVCWIAVLAVQFLADYFMILHGTSMNFYLIFNTVAMAGGSFLTVYLSRCVPQNISMMVFLGTCVVITGCHCALAAYQMPDSNLMVGYVDTLIFVFAVYLYFSYQESGTYDGTCVMVTFAAVVLNFLSINQLRTGAEAGHVIQGAGTGGKMILAGILIGSLLLTAGVVGLASGQIHSMVDLLLYVMQRVWSVLSVIGSVIGKILMAVILLIVMIFPSTPPAARQELWMQVKEEVEEQTEIVENVLPDWVLWVLFGLMLIALVGVILYEFRGVKIERRRQKRSQRKIVRKSRFFAALKAFLHRLKENLEFEIRYRRHRKTPQGLLVLAERVGRQQSRSLGRREQESPGAYLRRLGSVMDRDAFYELAQILDEIYYAGKSRILTDAEYSRYAAQIQGISQVKLEKELKKNEKNC